MQQARQAGDGVVTDEQRFVCGSCAQDILVNDEMHAAILTHGCPVCAGPVTDDMFTPVE